ncbi:MAG TPA: UDP-3-O-(3-hydroxymyristoyl)glucosamine N-acyltransferase [Planctomycetaceae bacterium]|jgi:UDP-3-O-[3-hydroxymyristoyl] glucosamine N-acyltransferase|nr:UDP-3-O-(3-hydroxymyristoyl)glucosamine N-acyltransferase [Planctomycetaceae bacterium]
MAITVAALAEWLDGQVLGNETLLIDRAQSLSKAGSGSIAFFAGTKVAGLKPVEGAAILIAQELSGLAAPLANERCAFIVVKHPKEALIRVAGRFTPRRARPEIGISCHAYVSATARVGKETNIHPGAQVGAGVIVGDRCDIHPGAVIGRNCRLGDDVVVYPNVVLYDDMIVGNRVILHAGAVIGADGFGYRTVGGRHEHIPHFGTVRIEDDVEVGANTTIDRAMVDETVIGQGTKLDNQVMIGHNCEIGRHNLFASQVGFAGSVTTGDYVVCAGQVGIADHAHLGSRSVLGPKAGVHGDIPEGQRYVGVPAVPEVECYRSVLALQKLPEMRQQFRKLERQVAELAVLADQLRKQIGEAEVAESRLSVKEAVSRPLRDAA